MAKDHMPMLEHEGAASGYGALAARSEGTIETIGSGDNILSRSFLVKKMEIDFLFLPNFDGDVSASDTFAGMLAFYKSSGATDADTLDEILDADLEDSAKHRNLIWAKHFDWYPHIFDITGNDLANYGKGVTLKTSKSFPNGYPLDKLETYKWVVMNLHGANAWDTGSVTYLRVRYWGAYL